MSSPRKHHINENYFDVWSHNMAYLLGFITTDGNVYENSIGISVQKRDEYVLDFFVQEIGPAPKDYRNVGKNGSARIRFNSAIMKKSLDKYGITPAKSFCIRADFDIPKEFIGDYIRGVFDGDGWVYCRRNLIESGFCSASKGFLEDIRTKTCIAGRNIRGRTKKGYDTILYSWEMSKADTIRLRDIMYKDLTAICLRRKKETMFSEFYIPAANRWRAEELELLRREYNGERGCVKRIANKLGRTPKSVSLKLMRLGRPVA